MSVKGARDQQRRDFCMCIHIVLNMLILNITVKPKKKVVSKIFYIHLVKLAEKNGFVSTFSICVSMYVVHYVFVLFNLLFSTSIDQSSRKEITFFGEAVSEAHLWQCPKILVEHKHCRYCGIKSI